MRVRITFAKTGALRYSGHLDLHRIWERTIRRASLPLSYSHGFHPQPKIQIASALPLGFSGCRELVDVWFEQPIEVKAAAASLQPAAPTGLTILNVEEIDERAPALQTQITFVEYEVILLNQMDGVALKQKIAALLAAVSLPRQRRGKSYDLRQLIEELKLTFVTNPSPADKRRRIEGMCQIAMRLSAREGATGRPEDVLNALGVRLEDSHIQRTRLIFQE